MIKNYFKSAWRNLVKDKQFSLLNLLGLSTGLACALLIYLWVSSELGVDRFNEHSDRLYQVLKRNPDDVEGFRIGANTQGLLASSMAKELPEVEWATSVKKQSEQGTL